MAKSNLTRREFVTKTITVGAGSVLIGKAAFGLSARKAISYTDPFQIVTMGKSGLKSTLLGMGTGFSGYNRSSNITRAGVAEKIIGRHMKREFGFLTVLTATEHIPLQQLHLKVSQGNHIR